MEDRKVITRYPRGFLSLLGVQSMGEAPSTLLNTVQSTMDVTQFMLVDRLGIGGGATGAIGAVGGFATGTLNGPSPGELWIVTHIDVKPSAVIGAGTTYNFQPALFTRGNVIALGTAVTGTTGSQPSCTYDGILLLQSGDQIGVWCNSGTFGVPQTFNCQERVCPVSF